MYQENSYTDLFENVISDSKAKRNMKERKYDARNKLNDLTGAEWQFSTRTVISKIYPSNLQHKLRSQHGGQKPPELCADLIKIFTKKGQTILDPLAGVGGSLLGAALCGREAIGIELNNKWIDIYKEVCKLEKLKEFKILVGDANERLREIKENSIDFVITDVPYWIMDKLKQTRSKNANRESKLTNFNDKELQTKQEWLSEMKDIFAKILPVLKNNGYMAVFIGDLYREKEYHFLSAELAQAISQIYGFILKSDIIWHDDSKMLHIYGYPFAYIPSLIHQHILIFRKEKECKLHL
ncbi:MAG: site-specific DNA-methyltransferase [Campylobacter sp.]|uniref:DNA methyltransferase n=2 Tax=Campylobacter sp. TaxID=205 RepID=UPI002AA61017|nr:DNA methyltransferase [Campylobacter sp.]MCI7549336.1 site-specific DNA-methyltransferase [Campylobacter sp.]